MFPGANTDKKQFGPLTHEDLYGVPRLPITELAVRTSSTNTSASAVGARKPSDRGQERKSPTGSPSSSQESDGDVERNTDQQARTPQHPRRARNAPILLCPHPDCEGHKPFTRKSALK